MPVDLDDLEVVTDALGKTTAAVALDDLVAPEFCAPKAWQSQAPETSYAGLKPPVQWHPEIQRIIDLPRRAPIDMRGPKAAALVKMMTARYTNGRAAGDGCDCESKHGRPCIVELRPAQAIALYEMRVAGGFVGSLAVGIGKCVDASTEIFDHVTGRRRRADEPGPLQVTAASEALRLSAHAATAFASGQ